MGMPWKYGVANTPGTVANGTPNIAVRTGASEFTEIVEAFWGGEVTTSTAMRTGIFRADEGVGGVALVPTRFAENQTASPRTEAVGPTFSTDPAPENSALWQTSWNGHGGVIRWLAAPGEEIIMLGTSTVIIENQVGGNTASTYGMVFGEF